MKDRRPHTAPVTRDPRLYRARDYCRRALKHYRAADQSAALFDFHVSVKNKNIRPISDRPFCFSATGVITTGLKITICVLNAENVTAATVFVAVKSDNKSCPVGLLLIICHM